MLGPTGGRALATETGAKDHGKWEKEDHKDVCKGGKQRLGDSKGGLRTATAAGHGENRGACGRSVTRKVIYDVRTKRNCGPMKAKQKTNSGACKVPRFGKRGHWGFDTHEGGRKHRGRAKIVEEKKVCKGERLGGTSEYA